MEEVSRKLLIIGVGSSACIHVLPRVFARSPEVFAKNEFMFIDTSSASLEAAVDRMTAVFREHHSARMGVIPERDRSFPVNLFKKRIEENSILLGGKGAGTLPENGLSIFDENKDLVLRRIEGIIKRVEEESGGEKRIEGIIVVGCSGKGTGTLVTPFLYKLLLGKFPKMGVYPLGFITLPFRFRPADNINAKKTVNFIVDNNVPMFVIDYENALEAHMYLHGKEPSRESLRSFYDCVAEILSEVLSVLIEALNLVDRCEPPIDFYDLMRLLRIDRCVGTVAISVANSEEEFKERWKNDIESTMMLRTKTLPSRTLGVTIVRSESGIPVDVAKEIGDYAKNSLRSEDHIVYELYYGQKYKMISLIFGFDPLDIVPEVTPTSKGILHRLLGR